MPKPNQDVRATCWSVTINNPIAADDENIQLARQKGWRVDGQPEVGANGTRHYQLIVKTPQVRWSALTKQFPRAHVEPARNAAALEQYVHKQDTKAGELPETSEYYPSLAKMWDMFYLWYIRRYCNDSHDPLEYKYIPSSDTRLEVYDKFISDSISKGYHVETMGVNPQMRSCVVKYMDAIFARTRNNIRRQTDRQTDETIVETDSITTDASS